MREFSLSKTKEFMVLGEKNVVLIHTPSQQIISFGDTKTGSARMILHSLQPYFFRSQIIKVEEQEEGKEFQGQDFKLRVLSENLANLEFQNQRFWLIGELSAETLMNLKLLSISFASDFWVLRNNNFPDFFPLPSQGILYLGENKPSKSLETLAKENKIPLVTIKETGGFSLEFLQGAWKLRARQ